jgi:hypothetical protein
MSDNTVAVIICIGASLYNILLLLCSTYLVIKFNNAWYFALLLFSRSIHYHSDEKGKD